jgi:hypothetical protein
VGLSRGVLRGRQRDLGADARALATRTVDRDGGGCDGDSGGPVLPHDTNTVVGMTNGGDPLCRAKVTPSRLDIPVARAFFRDHVQLP